MRGSFELYVGSILKEVMFRALQSGLTQEDLVSQVDWALSAAIREMEADIDQMNGGH